VTLDGLTGNEPPIDLDQIVADACRQVGIPARRTRLLRHFANAVYLIEDVPVVARVAYGQGAVERSRTAVAIAHWLAQARFPATEPARLPGHHQPAVIEVGAHVAVSFWRYYPQPTDGRRHDPHTLGEIARRLHAVNTVPPTPLKAYQPLRSITREVNNAATTGALDDGALRWLGDRIHQLLDEYDTLEFPLGVGLIHADMYTGNLLWNVNEPSAASGEPAAVLGDWDSVCLGPREIDLAPTLTATRFGLADTAVDRFVSGYGYDLRGWAGYSTLRAMRELSTLTALVRLAPSQTTAARELRHRLDTLRSGDAHTLWTRQ